MYGQKLLQLFHVFQRSQISCSGSELALPTAIQCIFGFDSFAHPTPFTLFECLSHTSLNLLGIHAAHQARGHFHSYAR